MYSQNVKKGGEKMYAFVGLAEMGKRLIELRGKRKQSEVAAAVGITPAALANYEAGIRVPRDDVKAELANYYNTSIESIFFV